ncbi:MAG: hypothetical protein JSV97_11375 [candidate division WOR-3 bacterium]|nr:MAG: hypothetical protein JSV97_11375 [candidate division WOR-3 bacterium]
MSLQQALTITEGTAMVYYCYDVGYEIRLSGLERVRGKRTQQSFLSFTRLMPPYIQYKTPPLLIRLGKKRMSIDGKEFTVSIDAKIYDFGVITVRFVFPISGSLNQLQSLNFTLIENKTLRDKVMKEFKKIRSDILSSIVEPRSNFLDDWEEYTIFMVHGFNPDIGAAVLLNEYSTALAQLLRTDRNLSRNEIDEALKNPLSYREGDLTLIDWSTAFIFDPEKSYDIPDVIEFAVIQLLELRLYDDILDTIIDDAYDTLVPARFSISPFSGTLKKLSQIKLDISEIVDRLENYLKLIGDLYLAKIYTTASKRFYLEHWKSAVRGKLATIESLYTASWERTQTKRMVILETAIVVLFIIDIILIIIELL